MTTTVPHVPTSVYQRLLEQRGHDLDRIKALECIVRDAWLVCQAGREVGDGLVVKVLADRVATWKAVLDAPALKPIQGSPDA